MYGEGRQSAPPFPPNHRQRSSDPCVHRAGRSKSFPLVVGRETASWRVPPSEHVIRELGCAC